MKFAPEEISELLNCYPDTVCSEEGGTTYFLIPNLVLPVGCIPSQVDALLRPSEVNGYPCMLYFAEHITLNSSRNWNMLNVRILNRNWSAFSWKVHPNLSLLKMVSAHLEGLMP